MEKDRAAEVVVKMFQAWGFEASRLDETNDSRRPDVLAQYDSETYLIEVKEKLDRADRQEKMEAAFSRGNLFEEHEPIGVRNTIAGIARDAVEQIMAYDPAESDLRLIWFWSNGRRGDVFIKQALSTFLGATLLVDIQDHSWQRDCYFFHDSVFFRWANVLDGAIIASPQSGQLIINNYSPRANELRSSRLATTMKCGVLDPEALFATDDAVLVKADIDRRDRAAVLKWVQQKFDRPMLINMEQEYMEICVRIPTEELENDTE